VIVKPFSQSSQETGAIYLKILGTVLPMASVHGIYYLIIHPLGEREARSRARNTNLNITSSVREARYIRMRDAHYPQFRDH